jgi:hypothetical protein
MLINVNQCLFKPDPDRSALIGRTACPDWQNGRARTSRSGPAQPAYAERGHGREYVSPRAGLGAPCWRLPRGAGRPSPHTQKEDSRAGSSRLRHRYRRVVCGQHKKGLPLHSTTVGGKNSRRHSRSNRAGAKHALLGHRVACIYIMYN